MLPKELESLAQAVQTGTPTEIDVNQLHRELAGVAEFHRQLVSGELMTGEQQALFAAHVGRYVDAGRGARELSITAPAGGPPKVVLRITAPGGGVPPVNAGGAGAPVECPNCHLVFTPVP
jgi:hypothetical protein